MAYPELTKPGRNIAIVLGVLLILSITAGVVLAVLYSNEYNKEKAPSLTRIGANMGEKSDFPNDTGVQVFEGNVSGVELDAMKTLSVKVPRLIDLKPGQLYGVIPYGQVHSTRDSTNYSQLEMRTSVGVDRMTNEGFVLNTNAVAVSTVNSPNLNAAFSELENLDAMSFQGFFFNVGGERVLCVRADRDLELSVNVSVSTGTYVTEWGPESVSVNLTTNDSDLLSVSACSSNSAIDTAWYLLLSKGRNVFVQREGGASFAVPNTGTLLGSNGGGRNSATAMGFDVKTNQFILGAAVVDQTGTRVHVYSATVAAGTTDVAAWQQVDTFQLPEGNAFVLSNALSMTVGTTIGGKSTLLLAGTGTGDGGTADVRSLRAYAWETSQWSLVPIETDATFDTRQYRMHVRPWGPDGLVVVFSTHTSIGDLPYSTPYMFVMTGDGTEAFKFHKVHLPNEIEGVREIRQDEDDNLLVVAPASRGLLRMVVDLDNVEVLEVHNMLPDVYPINVACVFPAQKSLGDLLLVVNGFRDPDTFLPTEVGTEGVVLALTGPDNTTLDLSYKIVTEETGQNLNPGSASVKGSRVFVGAGFLQPVTTTVPFHGRTMVGSQSVAAFSDAAVIVDTAEAKAKAKEVVGVVMSRANSSEYFMHDNTSHSFSVTASLSTTFPMVSSNPAPTPSYQDVLGITEPKPLDLGGGNRMLLWLEKVNATQIQLHSSSSTNLRDWTPKEAIRTPVSITTMPVDAPLLTSLCSTEQGHAYYFAVHDSTNILCWRYDATTRSWQEALDIPITSQATFYADYEVKEIQCVEDVGSVESPGQCLLAISTIDPGKAQSLETLPIPITGAVTESWKHFFAPAATADEEHSRFTLFNAVNKPRLCSVHKRSTSYVLTVGEYHSLGGVWGLTPVLFDYPFLRPWFNPTTSHTGITAAVSLDGSVVAMRLYPVTYHTIPSAINSDQQWFVMQGTLEPFPQFIVHDHFNSLSTFRALPNALRINKANDTLQILGHDGLDMYVENLPLFPNDKASTNRVIVGPLGKSEVLFPPAGKEKDYDLFVYDCRRDDHKATVVSGVSIIKEGAQDISISYIASEV
jgi:hypothetical protein